MNETSKTTGLNNHPCACGCKFGTLTPNATYLPGHDARHVSNLLAAVIKTGDLSQDNVNKFAKALPSHALQFKFQRAVDNFSARKAAKNTPKPKKAKREVIEILDAGTVKVGRWEYPAREIKYSDDTSLLQRNEKRDGSGAWIDLPA